MTKKRRKAMFAVALAIIACVLAFVVLEAIVLVGARTDIRDTPDVMVVLGAQVNAWGPSVLLEDRLKTAAAYLAEHPELPVVVSGGQGKDEPTSEAQCMRDYLVENGVAAERIWMEDTSHNTGQNLMNTRALLEAQGMTAADTHMLVVSNTFHLARVRMLAARYGLDASTLAAPSSHAMSRIQSYIREAPALVKSFLFD